MSYRAEGAGREERFACSPEDTNLAFVSRGERPDELNDLPDARLAADENDPADPEPRVLEIGIELRARLVTLEKLPGLRDLGHDRIVRKAATLRNPRLQLEIVADAESAWAAATASPRVLASSLRRIAET